MSLYSKLRFTAGEPLSCLQGMVLNIEIPCYTVRAATTHNLHACYRLCLSVHGHDRRQEVADEIAQGAARVVEHGGAVSGYATHIGFFAHAVGQTKKELKALVGAAAASGGPGFSLPMRNADLFRWCLAQGLRTVQPMTLMTMGLYQIPAGAFLRSVLC